LKKYFKLCVIIVPTVLILVSACRKERNSANNTLTTTQLVHAIIGNYNTIEICQTGNNVSGYVIDTNYNVPLSISTSDDSSIYLNGRQLFFSGNLSLKQYNFYSPSSGGGYNAQFDSTLHHIQFGYWDGGLGGGSGCSGNGSK
jgi:hypothetical protein